MYGLLIIIARSFWVLTVSWAQRQTHYVISHFSEQPARWRFVVIFYRLKEVHYLVFSHISLSDPKFQCFQPPLAAFSLPKIHPSKDIIRPLRQCSVNLSFRQKPRNVTVTLDVPQLFHSILQMRKQVERYNLPYGSTKWISNQKRV